MSFNGSPLREWLLHHAAVHPRFADQVVAVLEAEEVLSLDDLHRLAGHPRFDSCGLSVLSVLKIRDALARQQMQQTQQTQQPQQPQPQQSPQSPQSPPSPPSPQQAQVAFKEEANAEAEEVDQKAALRAIRDGATSVNLRCARECGSEAWGVWMGIGGAWARSRGRRAGARCGGERGDASALRVRALRLNGDPDPGCFGVAGVLHHRRQRHRRSRRESIRGGAREEHDGHVGQPRRCARVWLGGRGGWMGIGGAWARSRGRRAGARCGERGDASASRARVRSV